MAAVADAYVSNLPVTPQPPPPGWMDPAFQWFREAYSKIAAAELDAETALAEADARFSEYRQCVIDRDAFENYADWRACILEVDPALGQRFPAPAD